MNRVQVDELERFCLTALDRCGVGKEDAAKTVQVLLTTDLWGVYTHGTKALRGYVKRLRAGGLNPKGKPKVVAEGPSWARVDGGSSLAMVTGLFAMEKAMEKARQTGVAVATVFNSCHFGAAGYYTHWAARHGFLGMAVANDVPSVGMPGACGPLLGTNPFAFSAPAADGKPMNLDFATSVVAGGKVYRLAREGKPTPDGWLVDLQGQATRDPSLYPERASILPMAGHKGYGLCLLVETLSGALTGARMREKVGSWMKDSPEQATGHGHFFLAIHAETICPDFGTRAAGLSAGLRSFPVAPGASPMLIPGDLEREHEKRARAQGLDLPPDVRESLAGLAQDLGLKAPGGCS
jgi:LDH2 family malate/lactate/ureidoglycolate dehydrogenase